MANKRLGTAATELKLPTKKVKGEKKPKWQVKTGKKAKGCESVETPEVTVETPVQEELSLPPEPAETPVVATIMEVASVETNVADEATTTNAGTALTEPTAKDDVAMVEPGTPEDSTPTKKPHKLKIKTDAPPKKLSMMAAALQVLQDRKVAMTCPELIDVMATEGLWVSPGGKTPANTLYAAISRDIQEKGKESGFRKAERGRFEAKILPR